MHVIYMSVPAGSQPPDRTDSHGHCPRNTLTSTNLKHVPRPAPQPEPSSSYPAAIRCCAAAFSASYSASPCAEHPEYSKVGES
jgi:hypothetical protein